MASYKLLNRFRAESRWPLCVASLVVACAQANAADLTYLQSLLASTPEGGWVKANTNSFASSFAITGQGGLPAVQSTNPGTVVAAWSSFAWDSNNHDLLLFGGGHATYMGNEMYVWDGTTGQWGRGSLPSRIEPFGTYGTYLVVDDAAPQSSHTYDNNLFLPINNMFLTFGGAAYNAGVAGFEVRNGSGGVMRAGPWLWDPTKADPNKVGGTTGSGYLPSTLGGQMWTNRQGQWTGTEPWNPSRGYVWNVTAYREEAGMDVVYLSPQYQSTGFPDLFRYVVGDVRNGGIGQWQKVGVTANAYASGGVATIDSTHNLFIRTSPLPGQLADFSVWKLDNNNASNPSANKDIAIQLVNVDGSAFSLTDNFGMDYDSGNDKIYLWAGNQGSVWETQATFDSSGNLMNVWTVKPLSSTTTAQPNGNFFNGVYGKWKYVEELNAFVALDEFNFTNNSGADVWLYKPLATQVPEPGTAAFMVLGLAALMLHRRRREDRSSR